MRHTIVLRGATVGTADMNERAAGGELVLLGEFVPMPEYEVIRDICAAPARLVMAATMAAGESDGRPTMRPELVAEHSRLNKAVADPGLVLHDEAGRVVDTRSVLVGELPSPSATEPGGLLTVVAILKRGAE